MPIMLRIHPETSFLELGKFVATAHKAGIINILVVSPDELSSQTLEDLAPMCRWTANLPEAALASVVVDKDGNGRALIGVPDMETTNAQVVSVLPWTMVDRQVGGRVHPLVVVHPEAEVGQTMSTMDKFVSSCGRDISVLMDTELTSIMPSASVDRHKREVLKGEEVVPVAFWLQLATTDLEFVYLDVWTTDKPLRYLSIPRVDLKWSGE
ncbi:MAG: hypothetical protein H6739_37160 [Alphaproteobacteria bacterium]|nr:hypothetical protein [Alphaproteobacteria bacterium]